MIQDATNDFYYHQHFEICLQNFLATNSLSTDTLIALSLQL